ncbi:unnamed protein product [Parascedosporium putredinis]|uniref:Non-homologous end-joining factor 1 n=1 Tax=Parascedosporium putredinis TaxID=1442378 RepID=A0A9P1ME27_9PEZI|nr:unnamed protein product [Parascedosporium putredinis]CAI8001830.1 unnamed protein product [Parascedosporium putredinis]
MAMLGSEAQGRPTLHLSNTPRLTLPESRIPFRPPPERPFQKTAISIFVVLAPVSAYWLEVFRALFRRTQWRVNLASATLKRAGGLPALLASARFSTASYALHITDLAHIWSESLDRRAIILRALKEDASIDPSDGEDNMTSFLKCLRAAFDPDDPMHSRTRLAVEAGGGSGATGAAADDLLVTATCELPRELSEKPLVWRMYLKMQPASTTTAELDSVINKVLDKLEATGTSLEHVFTVLSSKRRVTREQAEARIKGLATFDWDAWNANVAEDSRQSPDGEVPELLRRVFDRGGLEYTQRNDSKTYAEGLGDWWHRMTGTAGILLPGDDGGDDDDIGAQDASEPESTTIGKGSAPPPNVSHLPPAGPSLLYRPSTRTGNNRAARETAARPASASGSATRSPTPEEGGDAEAKSPPAKSSPARPRGAGLGRIGGIGGIGGAKASPRQPSEEDEEDGFDGGSGANKRKTRSRVR